MDHSFDRKKFCQMLIIYEFLKSPTVKIHQSELFQEMHFYRLFPVFCWDQSVRFCDYRVRIDFRKLQRNFFGLVWLGEWQLRRDGISKIGPKKSALGPPRRPKIPFLFAPKISNHIQSWKVFVRKSFSEKADSSNSRFSGNKRDLQFWPGADTMWGILEGCVKKALHYRNG